MTIRVSLFERKDDWRWYEGQLVLLTVLFQASARIRSRCQAVQCSFVASLRFDSKIRRKQAF